MTYLSYSGKADLTLFIGDSVIEVPKLDVLFEQTHTDVFALHFVPDLSMRSQVTQLRVTLPTGQTEEGVVTYHKRGTLIFYSAAKVDG